LPVKKGESDKICMKGEVDEIKEVKDKNKFSNIEKSGLVKENSKMAKE